MTATTFQRTPFLAPDLDDEDDDELEAVLEAQYSGGWPTGWSRDLENRILPGLYIGGLPAARVAKGYDLIVNLSGIEVPAQRAWQGPPVIAWAIDDGPMPDVEMLWHLARTVTAVLTANKKSRVLVHCAAGINRSALLCAAVVMLLRKCDGIAATRIVRTARKGALCNPRFAAWLAGCGRPTQRRRKAVRP